MSRTSPASVLALADRSARVSTTLWLVDALRQEILSGRLRAGTRLPASRTLAREHGVARGTVQAAFEQLRVEGYVRARTGSGTYVTDVLPDQLLRVEAARGEEPERAGRSRRPPVRRLSHAGSRVERPASGRLPGLRAFRANHPALSLFPTTLWAQVTGRCVRRATLAHLVEGEVAGWMPLRKAVAEYLNQSRGVVCEPEQVLIVSGTQEAVDLVSRTLLDQGDTVCVEDPGYTGAVRLFEAHGARICPVRVDAEGMVVPSVRMRPPKLAYVTPAHQFPLGVTMTACRRIDLLAWARVTGAMVLEDDYDSEYRFAGRPVPALQGLDRRGVVLYTGSFSKVLFPGLRLGYLVVPPDLVDRFAAMKSVVGQHAPLLDQAVLHEFMVEGHFGRHVRRMREIYAARRCALRESVGRHLKGLLEVGGIEAGLQTAAWLAEGIDEERAAEAARERQVEVVPLGRYARKPQERAGLQLGFAAVDEEELERGARELAIALEAVRRSGGKAVRRSGGKAVRRSGGKAVRR